VNSTTAWQKHFDAAMRAIAVLPAEQQVEAVLQFLTTVLSEMSIEAIRQRRNQLMEHFSNCGGSYETCAVMLEMVDRYLAVREKWAPQWETSAGLSPRSAAGSM
jgi:hypothetical protein